MKAEGNETVTNCHSLKMRVPDGKLRITDVADTEQILRLVQSISSKRAKPFKLWLAQVGGEHLDETVGPELSIEHAIQNCTTWTTRRHQTQCAKVGHPATEQKNMRLMQCHWSWGAQIPAWRNANTDAL